MDILTRNERSEIMRRVRSKDTRPEMSVRRMVYRMGYRYRLHDRRLPGSPDLVFRSRSKIIFVHSCFWHRHPDPQCRLARLPKSRLDFWIPKLEGNRERDLRNLELLRRSGWTVLVVWECSLRDADAVAQEISEFLES